VRVFLDTNVLVSAFTTRGLCADVLTVVIEDHEPAVSEIVVTELHRVLSQKMTMSSALVEQIIDFISTNVLPEVEPRAAPRIKDEADALILAAAIAGGAEVLVTGDRDLLSVSDQVAEIAILSPRQFWELLRNREG
jgi:uncharacterized protein